MTGSTSRSKPRKITGASLAPAVAGKVKVEAGGRQIRLNRLFEEIWELSENYGRNQQS
jgi:hypothetical protein